MYYQGELNIIYRCRLNCMKLAAEDTLENPVPVGRVPKVQGVQTPNLSGKRTETDRKDFFCVCPKLQSC